MLVSEKESVLGLKVNPKSDYESGGQRVDKQGRPQWVVLAIHEPYDGGNPRILRVTIAAMTEPVVVPQQTRFVNLEFREYDFNGRSGVSYFASGLTTDDSEIIDLDEDGESDEH